MPTCQYGFQITELTKILYDQFTTVERSWNTPEWPSHAAWGFTAEDEVEEESGDWFAPEYAEFDA